MCQTMNKESDFMTCYIKCVDALVEELALCNQTPEHIQAAREIQEQLLPVAPNIELLPQQFVFDPAESRRVKVHYTICLTNLLRQLSAGAGAVGLAAARKLEEILEGALIAPTA